MISEPPVTDRVDGVSPPLRRLAVGVVNVLTTARLGLAFAFPFVAPAWRLPVVIAGGLSDLVDGWISRAAGAESTFGRIVDPIADKAFVASVLLTLWWAGELRPWQILLVGFRDLAVLGGSLFEVARRGWGCVRSMPPSRLGKLATAAQFVFLAAVMYHHHRTDQAFLVATGFSVAAGLGYIRRSLSTPRVD